MGYRVQSWRRHGSFVGLAGRFHPVLSLCGAGGCESLPLGPFLDITAEGGLREGRADLCVREALVPKVPLFRKALTHPLQPSAWRPTLGEKALEMVQ